MDLISSVLSASRAFAGVGVKFGADSEFDVQKGHQSLCNHLLLPYKLCKRLAGDAELV